ncbi:hypothetical protein FPE01S_03_07540 [Flavihumibacter petaseus NBRC 106054]|uniref:Uncharacterized protein n=2 Tax=Flavihumibacter TaxID=1004301 RepID=A0A0E9N5U3_9BACT|nr:hypothetical protein FPE01S_03_07540 [Flavihumibacter petaseus NBRC 106054]
MLTGTNIFAQTQAIPKKPSRNEVGSYNQANLLKVDLGVTKTKVLEVMGGVQKIQTYTSSSIVTKKEDVIINNPYNREFKTDSAGNTLEVLWYYTNVKKAEGDITKEQLTPIILDKNAVVGLGWDFYEGYAKRRGITLEQR